MLAWQGTLGLGLFWKYCGLDRLCLLPVAWDWRVHAIKVREPLWFHSLPLNKNLWTQYNEAKLWFLALSQCIDILSHLGLNCSDNQVPISSALTLQVVLLAFIQPKKVYFKYSLVVWVWSQLDTFITIDWRQLAPKTYVTKDTWPWITQVLLTLICFGF